MRGCITVTIGIAFGLLFKIKIRRKLRRVCIGNQTHGQNRQAALGGTHRRNIATLNEELSIALFLFVYVAMEAGVYSLDGLFEGSSTLFL